MKYAFIQRHRSVWPISVQCRVLGVSMAGYHEHFVRPASAAQRRHLSDDALLVHIKAIHAETRGGYGWPRTWKELLARQDVVLYNIGYYNSLLQKSIIDQKRRAAVEKDPSVAAQWPNDLLYTM